MFVTVLLLLNNYFLVLLHYRCPLLGTPLCVDTKSTTVYLNANYLDFKASFINSMKVIDVG